MRRIWPEVLEVVKDLRRFTWIMLSQNAQVVGVEGSTLTIALVNAGARDSFVNSGSPGYVQQALERVVGGQWRIDAIVDPTAGQSQDEPAPAAAPAAPAKPRGAAAPASVREAMQAGPPPEPEDPDASAHRDDPVLEPDPDPEALLSRELGAKIIDES